MQWRSPSMLAASPSTHLFDHPEAQLKNSLGHGPWPIWKSICKVWFCYNTRFHLGSGPLITSSLLRGAPGREDEVTRALGLTSCPVAHWLNILCHQRAWETWRYLQLCPSSARSTHQMRDWKLSNNISVGWRSDMAIEGHTTQLFIRRSTHSCIQLVLIF